MGSILTVLFTIPTLLASVAVVSMPAISLAPARSYADMPLTQPKPALVQEPTTTIATLEPATTTQPTPQEETCPGLPGSLECYCICWLRLHLGVNIKGDAKDIEGNVGLYEAHLGDVLLLHYQDGRAHGALITGYATKGWQIQHAYQDKTGKCGSHIDYIYQGDPRIYGVYRPS